MKEIVPRQTLAEYNAAGLPLTRSLLDLIAGRTYRHKENLSKPRKQDRKPHNSMSQKNC